MISFETIDYSTDEFVELFDELPLWSAPFGLLLLEHVPLEPRARMLDVGAGTGFLSVELAERCGSSSEVVAVDPWGAALRRLRVKIARLGLKNVSVIESSIEEVDLAPDSFDLVVSNLGLNNFADPSAAMRKCCRLLKPGGKLFISTNTGAHMMEFYELYRNVLEELGLSEALGALERHIDHRPTDASLATFLRDTGFEVIDRYHGSFVMRSANGSTLLRHHLIRLGFLPDWADVCPLERRQEVFELLDDRLNRLAAKTGVLSLSVPTLCVQARKPT